MDKDEVIGLGDEVMIRGEAGSYIVTQTRNTVGIISPNDELLLQKGMDGGDIRWRKRSELVLLKPARSTNQR